MVYCLPTHAIYPGLKARYSASCGWGEPPTSSISTPWNSGANSGSQNVLHNDAIGVTESKVAAGRHTLTIRPLDPGLVFEKIVIDLGDK